MTHNCVKDNRLRGQSGSCFTPDIPFRVSIWGPRYLLATRGSTVVGRCTDAGDVIGRAVRDTIRVDDTSATGDTIGNATREGTRYGGTGDTGDVADKAVCYRQKC